MTTAKKTTAGRQGFKTGEAVVYPAHGVGRITAIEEQEIAGYKLELFVVSFEKDKMVLRVPTAKANSVGMRKLAEPEVVKKALDVLTGRARVKRTMWSRRAQEYEAKINSGDLLAVTEVVRDLFRSEAQPEQSYSERQLYEAALDRIVREISSVNRITETEALKLIEQSLAKSPRRAKAEAEAESEGEPRVTTSRRRRPERSFHLLIELRKSPAVMAGLFRCMLGNGNRVTFPPGLVFRLWKAARTDPSFGKLIAILVRPSIIQRCRRGTFAFALPLPVAWRRSD